MAIGWEAWTAGLISLLAGLSTAVGGGIVLVRRRRAGSGPVVFAMGFSAGVMATVSLADLLPEAAALLRAGGWGLSGLPLAAAGVGMGIAALLDRLLPEGAADSAEDWQAMRVGIFSLLALLLHNIPEGVATFMACCSDLSLGIPVAAAIALHNIPEGVAIAVPICYGGGGRGRAFGYTLLAGLSEPFGALLCWLFLRRWMSDRLLGVTFALVAGVMLYLALEELLPTAEEYNRPFCSLAGVLCGCMVMATGLLCI